MPRGTSAVSCANHRGSVARLLGYTPGPKIKIALDALQEAQQLAEVSNRDEAEHWLIANQGSFTLDEDGQQ